MYTLNYSKSVACFLVSMEHRPRLNLEPWHGDPPCSLESVSGRRPIVDGLNVDSDCRDEVVDDKDER